MTEIFETAGKEVGLQAWRVENLRLVENQEAIMGSYYSGDSYVLLKTKMSENNIVLIFIRGMTFLIILLEFKSHF